MGVGIRKVAVGCDHYSASPFPVEFRELFHDGPSVCTIQIPGRFIRQYNGRVIDEGSGDGGTLHLSTR